MSSVIDNVNTVNGAENNNSSSIARERPRSRRIRIPTTHGRSGVANPARTEQWIEMMPMPSSIRPYQPTVEPIRDPGNSNSQNRLISSRNHSLLTRADHWTFLDSQFRITEGFIIKHIGWPCSPRFVIRARGKRNGLLYPLESLFVGDSLIRASKIFCDFSGRQWQTIRFHRNGLEYYDFVYQSSIWGGLASKNTSIYSPNYTGAVGYINVVKNIGNKAQIMDCVAGAAYATRGRNTGVESLIEIVDAEEEVIATMNATWGKGIGNDLGFEINFADKITDGPGHTKAILLTTLVVLAMEAKERGLKKDCLMLAVGGLLVSVVMAIFFRFGSYYALDNK